MNTLGVRGEVTPTSSGSSIYSYICADNTQLSFDREQSWHEMVRAAVDTTRGNLRGGMRGCATIEIVGNSKIMGTANEIEMANQNWQRVAVAGRKMSFNEA